MGANYKDDFDLLGLGLIILGFLEKNIGLQRNYYGLRAIYSELCLLNLVKSGENNNKLEKNSEKSEKIREKQWNLGDFRRKNNKF